MQPIPIGTRGTRVVDTTPEHTAASVGNPGVEVVGTAALIVFFEDASHNCLAPYFGKGEGSLGTVVNVEHLQAAVAGVTITATAELIRMEGRKLDFAVEVRDGDRLLMQGKHSRVVVNLDQFLNTVNENFAPSPPIERA